MRPLLITMGDPAGIGGEILLRAASTGQLASTGGRPIVVLDDPRRLADLAERLSLNLTIHCIEDTERLTASNLPVSPPGELIVWPLSERVVVEPGQPTTRAADAIVQSIDRAAIACLEGRAAGMITNPIAKSVLVRAGFRHPGHTEYLGYLATQAGFAIRKPVMMLAGPSLRTVPITVHVPLANVPLILRPELIVEAAEITAEGLREQFGIDHPRLAIAGLNPHAGEGGLMGEDEERVILPAIRQLQQQGLDVHGPLPSDTLFTVDRRESYDAALCMYHDQALIPVKTLDMDHTVNVTLGLPFIRTSPDHGTAFDIAGKGIARVDSLVAAVRLAADMAARVRADETV